MSASTHARSAFMADVERRLLKRQQPRERKPPTTSDSAFAAAREEAEESIASGDWSLAYPRHFVALYAILHAKVYGVEAGELTPTTRTLAAAAAKRMLEREFGGDKQLFASFMRWAWAREKKSVAWKRDNGRDIRRIGWPLCFGGSLVTDWRVATAGRR